jgi:superfamily II DNA or RNA helicase
MARRLLSDPEMRPLIERVATLAIEAGSVNRLQKRLTDVLAADRSEGWIYPNRLHALLNEDPTKGVNSETVEVLERALARVTPEAKGDWDKRVAEIRDETRRTWEAAAEPAGPSRLRAVSQRLSLPPAAVRLLLGGRAPAAPSAAVAASDASREPDWRFQDDAHTACVRDLQEDANAKIGLVLPTGAGKTRVATRISLTMLQSAPADAICLWVTHRTHLKIQALRELQRAVSAGTPDLPEDALALLGERVEMCMVSSLSARLDELGERVALVVVDEAHHAAAPSYETVFARSPLRGLFLTATPNRTDKLPIGIDRISYTTTYRELFERGVIIEPKLDELTIDGFDWGYPDRVRDLADYLLDVADGEFGKTLVVASRIDHVEALYKATIERFRDYPAHTLTEDDLVFVYGGHSSSGAPVQQFLDEFATRPRGLLIATNNLLGEGYDDPAVDAVVVTYATASIIQLMQSAGRCMRYAPGKSRATVVQLKDSPLAYHWEQRWLYQDISDTLRPQLKDVTYSTFDELAACVEQQLEAYRIPDGAASLVRAELATIEAGEDCALLLTGLPYDGPLQQFHDLSEWSALLLTPSNRDVVRRIFNEFSARLADVNDFDDFLSNYVDTAYRLWQPLKDMLWAMHYAAYEIGGKSYVGYERRPGMQHGTTWLTYVTFGHVPALPTQLADFLADAVNGHEIGTSYVNSPDAWALAAKLPLPLGQTLALLLTQDQAAWLQGSLAKLADEILAAAPAQAFAIIAAWRLGLGPVPVPQVVTERVDVLLGEAGRATYMLELQSLRAPPTNCA